MINKELFIKMNLRRQEYESNSRNDQEPGIYPQVYG